MTKWLSGLLAALLFSAAAHADVVDDFVSKNGYRVVYRFKSGLPGWNGYLAIGKGLPKVFYLTPDGRTVIYGLLADPATGREITGEDIKANQIGIQRALGVAGAPILGQVAEPAPVNARFNPAAWKASEKTLSYIRDGKVGSKDVVYVVFDPRCPHCHNYYNAIRSLQVNKEIRWVPIGPLGPQSALMAASALTESKGGKGTIDLLMGGVTLASAAPTPAMQAKVAANQAVMNAADPDAGVPYTIIHEGDEVVGIEGELPAAEAGKIFK